jgi:hypothetical protein
MLGGERLLKEFGLKRVTPDLLQHMQTDTFFQFTLDPATSKPEVIVKSSVTDVSSSHCPHRALTLRYR